MISSENVILKKLEIKSLAEKYDLDLVVLFGSVAKDRAIKESDIDIGVYKKSSDSYDLRIKMIREFSGIFRTDNVDVQIITSNSPVLMYNILKGKLLYEKKAGTFDRMKLYSWKLMAESKSFRDEHYEKLKNKILTT